MSTGEPRPPGAARSARRATPARLFATSDASRMLVAAAIAAFVRTLPESRWPKVSSFLSGLRPDRKSRRYDAFLAKVEAVFGEPVAEDVAAAWWRSFREAKYRRSIAHAAERRRAGWSPVIRLDGLDRLEAAVARGRGTILWCDWFGSESTVSMKGFAGAGIRIATVSHVLHGPARTALGVRALNRSWHAQQDRYVSERIVFGAGADTGAMRRLTELLAQNAVVRIANNAMVGKTVDVTLGRALLPVATTPLNLAVHGAALLPVAVIETVPLQEFTVRIGAPLVPATGDRHAAIAALAAGYGAYLVPLVRAHPGQWLGWQGLKHGSEPGRDRPGSSVDAT
jgi:lauroyl/myristoyl acyltransferase